MERRALPPLPLDAWEPTYLTLHRWTQVAGKIALALAPPLNHWWHIALEVTPQGLATQPLPLHGRSLSICFDLRDHRFAIDCSDGCWAGFELHPMPVARFYAQALRALHALDVDVTLYPVPVEVVDTTPLDQDMHHASYDWESVRRLHAALVEIDRVFRLFRGGFVGKSSPVNFYWGAFDLAVSRFSGRPNPDPPSDRVMREAYSHEVIAHGFWPGGDWPMGGRVDEALFYAYAVPTPDGFATADVAPFEARFDAKLGEFVLPYETVRSSADPERTLLDFMQTTYRAGAARLGWDVQALEVAREPDDFVDGRAMFAPGSKRGHQPRPHA